MLAGGSHMCPPQLVLLLTFTSVVTILTTLVVHRALKTDIASRMLCDVDSDSIQTLAHCTFDTPNTKLKTSSLLVNTTERKQNRTKKKNFPNFQFLIKQKKM